MCLLLLSVLHLAVLHHQQEVLKSLAQVLSLLPGQEVVNSRNHLYQVGCCGRVKRCCCLPSDLLRCSPSLTDSFAPGCHHPAERRGASAAVGWRRPNAGRSPWQHGAPFGVAAGRKRRDGGVSATVQRDERPPGAAQHSRYTHTHTQMCERTGVTGCVLVWFPW